MLVLSVIYSPTDKTVLRRGTDVNSGGHQEHRVLASTLRLFRGPDSHQAGRREARMHHYEQSPTVVGLLHQDLDVNAADEFLTVLLSACVFVVAFTLKLGVRELPHSIVRSANER